MIMWLWKLGFPVCDGADVGFLIIDEM